MTQANRARSLQPQPFSGYPDGLRNGLQDSSPETVQRRIRRQRSLLFQPNTCPRGRMPALGQPESRGWAARTISPAVRDFLEQRSPKSPCLVIDGAVVIKQYRQLQAEMPEASIYYAVKANPEAVPLLAAVGCSFDVASPAEVQLCLRTGVDPRQISYGNPVKKREDIIHAYEKGIRQFSFDCLPELETLAAVAPLSAVSCRILTSGKGADWPLSKKFGCHPDKAVELLRRARQLGLVPAGICFHVGSQQRDPSQWDKALASISKAAGALDKVCPKPLIINVGGGLPARYVHDTPPLADYARAIAQAVHRHLPCSPILIIEPGRYLVADADIIRSEIIRIRPPTSSDPRRWIYLDIGRFTGLAETEGEAILYPIVTEHDGGPEGPVVLAGPTCDSADILYERTSYRLPLALQAGDLVNILSAGAYTATYASVGFNGFPPPRTYMI